MLEIIFIEINFDGYRKFIAPMNLGPSGEAGGEKMDPLLRSQCDKIVLIEQGGRGPTKLMSPRKILRSCGSSSKLDLRRNLPIGVRKRAGKIHHYFLSRSAGIVSVGLGVCRTRWIFF